MLNCPNCQTEVNPTQAACPACGADVSLWIARGGQVFGPYTAADLQRAQAEGRLAADDQVKIGEGEWQPVSGVLAPATVKAALPPSPPPPMAYAPAQPAASANKSLTLIVVVIVLGSSLFVIALLAAIMFPVFARAREKARQASCASNLKQISLAMLMYAQDYNERFPPPPLATTPQRLEDGKLSGSGDIDMNRYYPPGDWRRVYYPYIKNSQIFACPVTSSAYSYQFNSALHLLPLGKIAQPAQMVGIYETGFLDASAPPPHNDGYNVGFVDGHMKWMHDKTGVMTSP